MLVNIYINGKVSFVLNSLLKKPIYYHCSQTGTGSFRKSWKKDSETSQKGSEVSLSLSFSISDLVFSINILP